ncbi:MAG TPA: PIN domain-containing protein [Burkholderiales bacterium]|nr:PIN domain-containing protein [Burkholderiales bacterium]
MGLIIDTNVLIRAERSRASIDFRQWEAHGDVFISAVTCSELLAGVHKADTIERRIKRAAFVEAVLDAFPVLVFDKEVARVHAQLMTTFPKAMSVGAHDLIIGATGIKHGFPVLTANAEEFSRMAGLTVLAFR